MNFWMGRAAPLEQRKQHIRSLTDHDLIDKMLYCGVPVAQMDIAELHGVITALMQHRSAELRYGLEKDND